MMMREDLKCLSPSICIHNSQPNFNKQKFKDYKRYLGKSLLEDLILFRMLEGKLLNFELVSQLNRIDLQNCLTLPSRFNTDLCFPFVRFEVNLIQDAPKQSK